MTPRQVQGHQRGRARRVDGNGGASQPKDEADPARRHAQAGPRDGVGRPGLPPLVRQRQGVLHGKAPDEDADAFASIAVAALQAALQKDSLLRVRGAGLQGAQAEALRVEQGEIAQEAAVHALGRPRGAPLVREDSVREPFEGPRGDRVASVPPRPFPRPSRYALDDSHWDPHPAGIILVHATRLPW